MPNDLSLDLRKAAIAHLRATAGVTNLVPSARIYPEFVPGGDPEWPFMRFGYPIAAPFEATGWDGSEVDFAMHIFARGPSMDAVQTITKAVIAAIDTFAPGNIEGAWCDWINTQVLPDEKPEDLHAVVQFRATAYEITA